METAISEENIRLSFGDMQVAEPDAVSINTGNRSVQLFFNPNNFPLPYEDGYINLCMEYRETSNTMTVQLVEDVLLGGRTDGLVAERSIETTGMTGLQKTVTFLYLVGSLLND